VDNQKGEITYAFTLLAPAPAVSGDGSLIKFEVLAVAQGWSTMELDTILASPDGMALSIDIHNGQVNVGTDLQASLTPSLVATTLTPTLVTYPSPTSTPLPPGEFTPTYVNKLTPIPSETPSPVGLASTAINQEINSTPSHPTSTENTQKATDSQEVIQTPTNTIIVEILIEKPTSKEETAAVMDEVKHNEGVSPSLSRLFLYIGIILVSILIGYVRYLRRRK